jgi:ribonuclease-3
MHPSRVIDRAESYERLEFLGDSILGLIVARELFERFPSAAEGQLSRLRSGVVSRKSCAAVARDIGLDRMFEEQFEMTDDLRRSDNVLAALIEAAIAALVLENGLDAMTGPVLDAFEPQIVAAEHAPTDYKTRLQEEAAASGWKVSYAVVATDGPAHDRRFTCEAIVSGRSCGSGSGRSKKEAQQAAAAMALVAIVRDAEPGHRRS